jgi:hypothetical protein
MRHHQSEKRNMTTKEKVSVTLLAIAVAAVFRFTADASAATKKKKVTYEQAWKLCKEQLDKENVPGTTTSNERYLRGGACMKNYGYSF